MNSVCRHLKTVLYCQQKKCGVYFIVQLLYIYKASAALAYCTSVAQVGFSNLVKRHKDQTRRIWVAEATQSSTYTISHEISKKSHLKEAATCAEKWASSSFDVSFFRLEITFIFEIF